MEWPSPSIPKPGLESVGLAVEDSRVFLRAFAAGRGLANVGAAIVRGEILSKRTSRGKELFLLAMRRRFIEQSFLPDAMKLSNLLDASTPPLARGQAMLPYLLGADTMARELVGALVLPKRAEAGAELCRDEVLASRRPIFATYEKKPWSVGTSAKWVRGFLSVLRDVQCLGRGKDLHRIVAYALRPEVTAFHLWGLYAHGLRSSGLVEHPLWQSLLLTPDEARAALGALVVRGWWRHTTLGAAEEITPLHRTLQEWMNHELGPNAI